MGKCIILLFRQLRFESVCFEIGIWLEILKTLSIDLKNMSEKTFGLFSWIKNGDWYSLFYHWAQNNGYYYDFYDWPPLSHSIAEFYDLI